MLAIKSDTRYRLKQKESNTQRFERNLLKQSKKASHVLLTPLPFQFYFPPQFFLFPFSTILLFSLLNVFIPSSTIFIIFRPQCFLFPSFTSTSSLLFISYLMVLLICNLQKRLIREAFWVLLQAMFIERLKTNRTEIKITRETTNNP